jgi:HEAT repeat protein
MALVRANAPEIPIERRKDGRSQEMLLTDGDADARRHAAHALSLTPAAAKCLAAQLDVEPDARVREAIFASLVAIGGKLVADLVAPLIRHDDAAVRGGAIETLKQLEDDAIDALDCLLDDPESDVRVLAIEVTRAWPPALATPRLLHIIEMDLHVNVCGAAVDVATEVGTKALLDGLGRLRVRFPQDAFLAFAADIAISRIDALGEPRAS